MKIAYLGPENTFTENITKKLFPEDELIPIKPIRKVIQAVELGNVDKGIVPIENFYSGEVIETLDALTEVSRTRIIESIGFSIKHCLGTLPENSEIKKIFSKDQAINQCSKYLCENYPNVETISVSSTSEAVNRIKNENMLDAGAIASEEALLNNNLKILSKEICPNNKTRFAILGNEETKPTGDDKTFLTFHPVKDRPGILQSCLGFFSNLGINLDYIQSRPDGKGGYRFYIELKGHEKDKAVKIAIKSLKYSLDSEDNYQEVVKILGSFPNTDWKKNNKI
ncbi:ACT domain-containing protein [Candidatus Pacearchaeota archaeon]|nr:ACT domain-containing protein [Candidatus Pacearchaeota archaeon]MBD3283800.1 ACT domain-containing protein [Candidatus Pacearchaeota archaeon]